ncbi:hypothetical protein [secondary endosymbiont of Heteropsylla cubana]|uniref:hypothetical protein n=1 Tax=secondary endosymbiont of Heteropsylla cubana TaxID=134287 RepID=UPI00135B820C|nr:hypothetical protein [secondary endosymbiont of Heteropsylla cubana]
MKLNKRDVSLKKNDNFSVVANFGIKSDDHESRSINVIFWKILDFNLHVLGRLITILSMRVNSVA